MTQNNVLFPIADLLVVRDLYEILLELGLEWSLHIVISANQMLIFLRVVSKSRANPWPCPNGNPQGYRYDQLV